jgi:Uma2 family endonuclease
MSSQVISVPISPGVPAGEIIAVDVSFDDYMELYAEQHHEWVRGYVIKMSPITAKHDDVTGYVYVVLKAYFSLNPIGIIRREPFVMKLTNMRSGREPDLQVILKTNPGQLTDTAMIGPADLVIEVVSPESVERDYGDKFREYEAGGVREYWVLDPLRKESRFYRLGDDGHYHSYAPDEAGNYTTPLLPKLALHVPTLWQDELPNVIEVVEMVKAMVQGA